MLDAGAAVADSFLTVARHRRKYSRCWLVGSGATRRRLDRRPVPDERRRRRGGDFSDQCRSQLGGSAEKMTLSSVPTTAHQKIQAALVTGVRTRSSTVTVASRLSDLAVHNRATDFLPTTS